jgi:hypothetical protein
VAIGAEFRLRCRERRDIDKAFDAILFGCECNGIAAVEIGFDEIIRCQTADCASNVQHDIAIACERYQSRFISE